MKTRKLIALLLACCMVFALLAGCGNTNDQPGNAGTPNEPGNAGAPNEPNPGTPAGPDEGQNGGEPAAPAYNILDERTIKIGVMNFNWTSRIATSLMKYCDYLAEDLNVEFEYFTCGFDNDSCISTVENMITAGCDGLILVVSSGITEIVDICSEEEIPVSLILGKPTDAEEALLHDKEWYTVDIVPARNASTSGILMAQAMLDLDYTTGAVVSTVPGMIEAGDQETAALIEHFESNGGTLVAKMFEVPGPTMMTAADTVITQYGDDIDFMYGLLDVLQGVVTTSNKSIKIVSNELPMDGGVSMFEDGTLAFALEKIPQAAGLALATIINKLNGQTYADTPSDPIVESLYTSISNAEECQLFIDVTDGQNGCDPCWNIDEVKSLILAYNPDATWADLEELAASTQLDQICARHGITR